MNRGPSGDAGLVGRTVVPRAPAEPQAFLFSYFTRNGEGGVLRTPRNIRHGSAFLAPESVLLALDSLAR